MSKTYLGGHDSVRIDLRLAGQVERYHTWPTITRQSDAEHTWQLTRILLTVDPYVSKDVLVYTQFHDCGEHHTGDLPYPVKRNNPVLKSEVDRIGGEGLQDMCEFWKLHIPALTDSEMLLVKLCEMIEMWEFGLHEQRLGNSYAALVSECCLHFVMHNLCNLSDREVQDRIIEYISLRKEISQS